MQFPHCNRRQLLKNVACGFGSLAFAGLAGQQHAAAAPVNPLSPKPVHHPARAKRIIFLFMQGGPSHVDSFDPKPELDKHDGKKIDFYNSRAMRVQPERVMKAMWKFKQYGECGMPVSELFPHIGEQADKLCLIRSMHTEGVAHGPATLFLHTGATSLIRPSMGSWITYGLGTESQDLPGFITINPTGSMGGPRNYANAFLPTAYQGTVIGRAGQDMSKAGIRYLTNDRMPLAEQKKQFDLLQALNREQLQQHGSDDELNAVVESFELAWRMQTNAPDIIDLSRETPETMSMYGIDDKATENFGRQCLMARRFAEAGVRYIQVSYSDNGNTPRFDQHSDMPAHATHAKAVDKPVAGLLKDLAARGLLDDTLVWWGGEFGRTPFAQGGNGRDHNPSGFSTWLAGAGVKPGFIHGATDDFGHNAVTDKVHMHDLHATILWLMGLDHKRITYRYAGRDFRLTDVAGNVVREIFS